MRTSLLFLTTVLLLLGACRAPQQAASAPPTPPPEFRPTSTIKDIMDSMVDPSADAIWEAVATTVDASGIHDRYPKNDDEWKEVRRRAITLLEATNLLLMPGRQVAKHGEKSENPGIELEPEQMEGLINQDRDAFNKLAHGLYDATMSSLKAIEAKDRDAVLSTGDGLDRACENCHLKYWYPNEAKNLQNAIQKQ
jgi:hypothetical protein